MLKLPKKTLLLLTTLTLGLLTACTGATSNPTTAAQEGKLQVLVAFYPFEFVAERVGGDQVQVTSLTQPGSDPHDIELTPRQMAAIGDADLVIYQKGFQPALDEAVAQSSPKTVLDVASVVELRPADSADHEDHEDHAGETAEEHAEHDHGGLDPHSWLDPTNMVTVSTATADALAAADATQSETFRTNAAQLTNDLTGLDEKFSTGLAQCERREFVTSHAAFGYLADRYDLTQIAIRGLSAQEEPSPARIAEVQALAREHGVTTIFYEQLVSPAVAESVAGDLGLRTDVLDPLEGLTDDARGEDYLEVMGSNLAALRTANQCV